MAFLNIFLYFYLFIFSSILFIIVLFILFSSLFIISIKSSIDNTITSISVNAFTVAVLLSSFSSAISQNIAHECSSAILVEFISIDTFQVFSIYHSQLDSSHSTITISQFRYFLSLQF
ncbi:hypothetical protein HOF65_06030 [bacterium]|nr:hypothetical protein [bacterium]MBT3729479.1 hypothetical protein [bacterium]MBT3853489.1 hypothetical protein [bacterium]MBT4633605.1 hypothetical protein [bacterium]MBT5491411.1 hypothetical protein [bacterium]